VSEVPGVVEHKSAQQAAAREEPAVREHESRQRARERLNKTFEMACKFVHGQYIFHQPCGLWRTQVILFSHIVLSYCCVVVL
jgi:hypothetical protein